MLLLETVPQDIKTARDATPCAPNFFRWVVIGGYLSVILCVVVWGLFLLREKSQNTLAEKDKQRMAEINKQIEEVRAQGAQSEKIRARYEDWQQWLKENYSLSRFLMDLYSALPQEARLQELSLLSQPVTPGVFTMKMRFFSQGDSRSPDTQDFEDKLTTLGVDTQDRQQSVGEAGKTEINGTLNIPRGYYPGGTPPKIIQTAKETPPGVPQIKEEVKK